MNDFEFTHHYRWLGNYVLSIVCIIVLFAFSVRRNRPSWLAGATVFVQLFIALFLAAAVVDWYSEPPKTPHWGPTFSLPLVFTWFSALPIQMVFNLLLGEDNIFEKHLLIPTALLMWGGIGAALGAIRAKVRAQRTMKSRPRRPKQALQRTLLR